MLKRAQRRQGRLRTRGIAGASVLLLTTGFLPALVTPAAEAAPVGQGFALNASDLRFILKQIKIAEANATKEGSDGAPVPGQPLFGTGPNQVSHALLPYGLRTVDGSYNNGQPGQSNFGAASVPFPRMTTADFRVAELNDGTFGPPGPTTYAQKKGAVIDSQPRVVSNLIVDQTVTNPAAVVAAGTPHRSFNQDPSATPCRTGPADPPRCTPKGETLFIPNVTTDVGLSPPYNSWFTLFGQFFDHGVDSTVKKGGTVFVPLKADDPLVLGKDGTAGTTDDLPAKKRFMVLTRAKNQPGPDRIVGDIPATTDVDESADDIQNATNVDSPWVDQSQTYTSNSSHQVFLREYTPNADGRPVATGKMLEGVEPDGTTKGGMATWRSVKDQAASVLGIKLTDADVLNIPMVAADEYGRFLRGPDRGMPQLVTASGLKEGNADAPLAVPVDVKRIDIAFLDDIAHHATPGMYDADGDPATRADLLPQTPDSDPGTADDNDPKSYDDEMLDAHFAAGDGRVNENIGLTAIHQVFHSEHNRLVGHVKDVLNADTSTSGEAALAEWKLVAGADGWNGERLFQAARFVTEMEYQHIVFEEFARKVQPGINPFNVFTQSDTAINPAIKAEFAHAVYRFGHSMLTDTVARTKTADGSNHDVSLLEGFLNPPTYYKGMDSAAEAAGSIAMGMTDQTGNELDEFVTETLRNNLLGLPLDLPTINMARAREAGVPSLNNFRKDLYRQTQLSDLQPYSSWVDFGLSLKHQYSVINFMAAYGQHPTITSATTLAGKRAAATLIYENDPANAATPQDAEAFVNSTPNPVAGGKDWSTTPDGVSRTGLDDVDLWVGGLAESQNLFGGLLGSTFNYVFERQLTDLQDGDRLYYLSRTSGLNLRTQLEGNSFAELVMRNTTAESLKADSFGTADCEFDLRHPTFQGTGNTIADDPTTPDCDESKVLIRMADGTIRYRQTNSVDPSGINAQSTFNGTPAADRMWGGVDNDTFWGNEGSDRIEGSDGSDHALGGDGEDIITDSAGDDVLKGGDGNDAIDAGPGLDLIQSGFGKDFVDGGLNANTTFAGEGDDVVFAGDGPDTVFGGGGDDWQEGGNANDLLQGDSGAPFFDDINAPGHDVLIGGSGEDDYDAEGGDDIMVAGPGIERNHGTRGFDWAIHAGSPDAGDSDLNIHINAAPGQLADRFLLTEALSGWDKDDDLKGDNWVPIEQDVELHAPWGSNALTEEGINRINGLRPLLEGHITCVTDPQLPGDEGEGGPPATGTPIEVCGFGEGNILLGGGGSDLIRGRGADDIIDGDAWLNVRLVARYADGSTKSATSMRELKPDVFAGKLDPGSIEVVREILTTGPVGVDTAVYAGPRADYDVLAGPNGTITVTHARNQLVAGDDDQGVGFIGDGVDTLRNIEQLRFADQTVPAALGATTAPGAPTIGTATAGDASATATWTAPASDGGSTITGYSVRVVDAADAQVGALRPAAAGATSLVVTGLTNGQAYRFQVTASNPAGTSGQSALSNAVTPAAAPGAPAIGTATPGNASAAVTWVAPASDGGSAVTGYSVRVVDAANAQVGGLRSAAAGDTSALVTGLTNGQAYRFQVSATNRAGGGAYSALSDAVTPSVPATVAGRPTIRTAVAGDASATARWTAPASNGGSPITGYEVRVVTARGAQVGSLRPAAAGATSLLLTGLTHQAYRFQVRAINGAGASTFSTLSGAVTPRTVPGRPRIGTAASGAAGGAVNATARWGAAAANGSNVTGYLVTALRMSSTAANATVLSRTSVWRSGTSYLMALPAGTYRFEVRARNGVGLGAYSERSNAVTAR